MHGGWRWIGIDYGDKEEKVNEERADNVNLSANHQLNENSRRGKYDVTHHY